MEQSPLAIHHVGVAVPSIDDAMHFYGDQMGLSVVDMLELPERQLKVAFVQAANMLVELLEPTDPNSTVSRFLERRGPGLHHLCFGTPDIRRHLRDLQDKGVELIDAEPRPGAHGEVAFLQPSAGLGVLVELLQPTETPAAGSDAAREVNASASAPSEAPGASAADGTSMSNAAAAPSEAAPADSPSSTSAPGGTDTSATPRGSGDTPGAPPPPAGGPPPA